MAVHGIADRLARRQALHMVDHGLGARVVQRRLHQHQVVRHFDGYAVVRAAGHEPDAVGHLFGDHALTLVARRVRHRERGDGHVGLHVPDREVEHRMAARGLADAGRELHPAEIAVVAVPGQRGGVAEHRVGKGGGHLRHQAVGGDGDVGLDPAGHRERDHAAACRAGDHRGAAALGGLEHAVRRDPELVHAVGHESRAGRHVATRDVPGHVAGDELVVALLAGQRVAAAAARLGARQHDLVAHRSAFVVHRAHHRVVGHLGPGAVGQVGLAEGEAFAFAHVADRAQARRAHGLGRLGDHVGGGRGRRGAAASQHQWQRDDGGEPPCTERQ